MKTPITKFTRLLDEALMLASEKGKVRAALMGADDPPHVEALVAASREGLVDPILIGPRKKIEAIVSRCGFAPDEQAIIESDSAPHTIATAVKLAMDHKVDLLIRGTVTTVAVMNRLFGKNADFRIGKNIVSHVAAFEHPKYPKLLLLSDAAVSPAPDLARKIAIVQNAVAAARLLGIEKPKVAILAAVEMIYPGMPVTLDGAVLAKLADRGQIKHCLIDGPLSLDVATVPEIAQLKGATSEVAGQADILIAPNIETANGIYKAMALMVKAKTAGIIYGGKVPIAISSRCDTVESMHNSLALGSLVALSGR